MPDDPPPWWKRSMLASHLVTIVPADDFVTFPDAEAALGLRRRPWVNLMLSRRDLELAATHPRPWTEGDLGVTASSLARQVAGWSQATVAERRRRKRRLLLGQLVRSV